MVELRDRIFGLFVVVAAMVAVVGCSSGRPSATAVPSVPGGVAAQGAGSVATGTSGTAIPAVIGAPPAVSRPATYVIGPGDLVEVTVFKVDELLTKERVNESGAITMPLIGRIVIGGLTPEQAAGHIALELGRDHLQNPQVNVLVVEHANMNVTVGGAVKKPGVFPMPGQMTLLQAIAMAEGVTEIAKPSEVAVFRTLPGQATTAYVTDLRKIERGEIPDPILTVNDKVFVPESGSAVLVKNITGAIRGLVYFRPIGY
jgi:polysaccharide export outer membrane protein